MTIGPGPRRLGLVLALVISGCATTERTAAPLDAQKAFRADAARYGERIQQDNAVLGAAGGLALCALLDCNRADALRAGVVAGVVAGEVGASYAAPRVSGDRLSPRLLRDDTKRAAGITRELAESVGLARRAVSEIEGHLAALPPIRPVETNNAVIRSLLVDRRSFARVEVAAVRDLRSLNRTMSVYALRGFDLRPLRREFAAQQSLLRDFREIEDRHARLQGRLGPVRATTRTVAKQHSQ